jgi:hypothetical protein
MYIIYFCAFVLSWLIFYYVVKAAVTNGIKEAQPKPVKPSVVHSRPELNELQQQYDSGKITFEAFRLQWEKLTTPNNQ